jgi:hypothetical protein
MPTRCFIPPEKVRNRRACSMLRMARTTNQKLFQVRCEVDVVLDQEAASREIPTRSRKTPRIIHRSLSHAGARRSARARRRQAPHWCWRAQQAPTRLQSPP